MIRASLLPRSTRLLLLIVLCVGSAVALRWRTLKSEIWSLDEGVTFTMAEQVVHGDVLYRDAVDHRSPMVPILKAAIFEVTGDWNIFAVHLVMAALLGLAAVALWSTATSLGDRRTGGVAALVFTVMSYVALEPMDAFSASTGWFLVFFSTLGFALFAAALARSRWWLSCLSGACFGVSLLCKQPGLLDFGVTWVVLGLLAIFTPSRRADALKLWLSSLAGCAVPIAFVALYAIRHGVLHELLYYSYTYNTHLYVPEVPVLERWIAMRRPFTLLAAYAPALLIPILLGAVMLLWIAVRQIWGQRRTLEPLPWLILGWSAAGIVSTGLSGREFSHYSTQVIPGFSLAAGWAVARSWEWAAKSRWRLAKAFIGAGLLVVGFFVARNCIVRVRVPGPSDPYGTHVGDLIRKSTQENERILVWGYVPELYVYARRLPASRFIYSNFVTGLIPWTNLDPLKDTSYAIVPNGREQLASDLRRHPPAILADTGGTRGYMKYPLIHEPFWQEMVYDYARICTEESGSRGVRLFRHLANSESVPVQLTGQTNPAVIVSGYGTLEAHQPAGVRVRAPAGFRQIDLLFGAQRVASLEHSPEVAVDVVFYPRREPRNDEPVRVRLIDPAGNISLSSTVDFRAYLAQMARFRTAGPLLHTAKGDWEPLSVERTTETPERSNSTVEAWRADSPCVFEYPDSPDIQSISFVHGLEPAAIGKSDGYDFVVEHLGDNGNRIVINTQRLHPLAEGKDQMIQRIHLTLPPRGPGRLIFRVTPGIRGDPSYDWIYFGQLRAGVDGAPLAYDGRSILPTVAYASANQPMNQNEQSRWNANSPSKVQWDIPDDLTLVKFAYGMEESSYANPAGHTDGIAVSVMLLTDSTPQQLYTRVLDPFNIKSDRGAQAATVAVPPGKGRKLAIEVSPGPKGDPSWDWAWLLNVVGETQNQ